MLALAVGMGIHWLYPLSTALGTGALRFAVGGVLVIAGLAAMGLAIGWFRKTGQDPAPWKESPELIIEGIYKWTRNPMYLGMGLLQAGLGLLFGSVWPLVLVPVTWWVIYRIAIRHEEAYLAGKVRRELRAIPQLCAPVDLRKGKDEDSSRLVVGLVSLTAMACGHGHGLRDRHPHAPRDIETYISRLESPERTAALQVERVIETLGLRSSDTVADIGSGPGVFSLPLGEKLSSGLVYAVDVEPKQLDALRTRVAAAKLANVVPVLGGFEDPFLPAERCRPSARRRHVSPHRESKTVFRERLKRVLRDGGRLAIVEWKPGELRMGPPPDHKLAEGERESELRAAGFVRVESFDFLELHDFEVWKPAH